MRIKRFISSKVIGYSQDFTITHYQHELELLDGTIKLMYSSEKKSSVTAHHKLTETPPKIEVAVENNKGE